jgi:hypothetical protein
VAGLVRKTETTVISPASLAFTEFLIAFPTRRRLGGKKPKCFKEIAYRLFIASFLSANFLQWHLQKCSWQTAFADRNTPDYKQQILASQIQARNSESCNQNVGVRVKMASHIKPEEL